MGRVAGSGFPPGAVPPVIAGFQLPDLRIWMIIGGLASSGVLVVATNLFGGTKSGAEMTAKALDALSSAAPGSDTMK